jgi:hypothetical protein
MHSNSGNMDDSSLASSRPGTVVKEMLPHGRVIRWAGQLQGWGRPSDLPASVRRPESKGRGRKRYRVRVH